MTFGSHNLTSEDVGSFAKIIGQVSIGEFDDCIETIFSPRRPAQSSAPLGKSSVSKSSNAGIV